MPIGWRCLCNEMPTSGAVRRFSAVVGASVDRAALRAQDLIADDIDYTGGALSARCRTSCCGDRRLTEPAH